MKNKMCDCNQGRLPCSCLESGDCSGCAPKYARPFIRPQATMLVDLHVAERDKYHEMVRKFLRAESPTGPVHMDSMMGKSFTAWFLIKCGLVGIAVAYVFDWAIMSVPA